MGNLFFKTLQQGVNAVLSALLIGALALPLHAQLEVATLNPILADVVGQVGGEKVKVIQIVKAGDDPHSFTPRSKDLKAMKSAKAIFAMGKGLETYLPGLHDSLEQGQVIIEVGKTIPSQKVDADPLYTCCPNHDRNAVDPHWWHNAKNMERAAKVVYKELRKLDPANKDYYKKNSELVRKNYRDLHSWVKGQVSSIPKDQRVLVTAHAAFAYFCKEYGFEAAYVQGLSREGEISAQVLSNTVKELQRREIRAVFPEKGANPKMLSQIAKETGAKIGQPLYADHFHQTYERTIRYNVKSITDALK